MTMSRVLLPLTTASAASAIETAIAATRILNGKIDALYIENGGSGTYMTAAPAGVPAGEWRMATADLATHASGQDTAQRREREAEQLREKFHEACTDAGISLVAIDEETGTLSASWAETTGSPRKLIVDQGAAHDLVISAGTTQDNDARTLVEAALLRARRPVMLAPTRLQKPLTENVVIAWDESPECWAAVEAAMPFLAAANSVQVITVDKDRDRPRTSQQRLLDYLRERGIEAEAKVVDPLSRPIGQALLSEAGDRGAGLMVMGAYSHSPLREFFFGGATREVLKNAAATPVLMAH